VRGVREQAIQNNVVFETELQDFEGLVNPEALTNQHPWFLVSVSLSLGSNTRISLSKLILESVYPDSEHA
jgi:hypothetical protein